MFNLTSEKIKASDAFYTATEIYQQPKVWTELLRELFEEQEAFQSFLNSIYERHESVRVIFSGAGTSAFVGDILVPELTKLNENNITFESIATTDIVSNPEEYLIKDIPTILVSFARSGNSPESVATVNLGQKLITDFYQVVITCNQEGQLAQNVKNDENSIVLLMPEAANDKSLAMTSSFTCMTLAAYALFTNINQLNEQTSQLIESGTEFVNKVGVIVDEVLAFDFERIVYLGSGGLAELSHEAALKMLELSGGQVVAVHESSLGFRHGPKSILNDKSVVVLFISQDVYTKKYDLDILKELAGAKSNMKIITLVEEECEEIGKLADWQICINEGGKKLSSDLYLALLYIIFAQVLAMKKSIQLGITPDNPSPDGAISRVVKGVTIYDY